MTQRYIIICGIFCFLLFVVGSLSFRKDEEKKEVIEYNISNDMYTE
jgi:hypothetical protein